MDDQEFNTRAERLARFMADEHNLNHNDLAARGLVAGCSALRWEDFLFRAATIIRHIDEPCAAQS